MTQPDRPSGRGMEAGGLAGEAHRARAWAPGRTQPEKIKNNDEFRAQLESIAPEAIIVVGYGRIIPQWMIDLPQAGQHQSARIAAAEIPRGRADPVGDCDWAKTSPA